MTVRDQSLPRRSDRSVLDAENDSHTVYESDPDVGSDSDTPWNSGEDPYEDQERSAGAESVMGDECKRQYTCLLVAYLCSRIHFTNCGGVESRSQSYPRCHRLHDKTSFTNARTRPYLLVCCHITQ
jgi:hypothetical protein